ncbi:MAG TPA: TIGR03435 family protein, partial [Candidatus Acidoferrales bacterium]|nr:TIGR03435 family protein [Candidatus Acidoferrales bacterium]
MRIRFAFALAILLAGSIFVFNVRKTRAQDAQSQAPAAKANETRTSQATPRAAASDDGKFAAVSIKVDNSGSGRHSANWNLGGGRLRAVNFSLAGFMVYAYQLPANRIIGAPDWFDSEYFDADATTASADDSTDNRGRIQAMLADRFKLIVHYETRDLPVYALVLEKPGKLGPQLEMTDKNCSNWHKTDLSKPNAASSETSSPDDVNCGDTSGSANNKRARYLGHGVGMDKLVEVLSGSPSHAFVERPIVDRTGLTGNVDFVLEFAMPQLTPSNEQASADSPSLPSFTSALREELGLRLESATAPVDVL